MEAEGGQRLSPEAIVRRCLQGYSLADYTMLLPPATASNDTRILCQRHPLSAASSASSILCQQHPLLGNSLVNSLWRQPQEKLLHTRPVFGTGLASDRTRTARNPTFVSGDRVRSRIEPARAGP